mmetsp:Transcript_94441/g.267113  ORF Transcript_94441/g.267113 Transcript_94441/m.267113 type:complete len:251 (-) Transcript_94441:149-901(-)
MAVHQGLVRCVEGLVPAEAHEQAEAVDDAPERALLLRGVLARLDNVPHELAEHAQALEGVERSLLPRLLPEQPLLRRLALRDRLRQRAQRGLLLRPRRLAREPGGALSPKDACALAPEAGGAPPHEEAAAAGPLARQLAPYGHHRGRSGQRAVLWDEAVGQPVQDADDHERQGGRRQRVGNLRHGMPPHQQLHAPGPEPQQAPAHGHCEEGQQRVPRARPPAGLGEAVVLLDCHRDVRGEDQCREEAAGA